MEWKEYIGYGILATVMVGGSYLISQAEHKDFCENKEPRLYQVLDAIGPRTIDCRNESKDISDIVKK